MTLLGIVLTMNAIRRGCPTGGSLCRSLAQIVGEQALISEMPTSLVTGCLLNFVLS
jgi:hypothetical protein